MNSLSERVMAFIRYKGLTVAQFEQSCELGNGTVSSLSAKSRKSTLNRIISFYPELSLEWLLTGQGEMVRPIASSETDRDDDTSPDITVRLIELLVAKDSQISKSQQQITKAQEQIDRLLTMIEGDRGR